VALCANIDLIDFMVTLGMKALPEIPSRRETIQAFKGIGGKVAGVLPIHYPRALLRAFNILPVEIWGPPGIDPIFGSAHIQPYICSIVRNALSFIQTAPFEAVDILLVPHACDSLQGLGSMLLDFIHPQQPVLPLYLPRGGGMNQVSFLKDEIESLYLRLENWTGTSPSRDEMMQRILEEENADQKLALLHEQRQNLNLSNIVFYRLVRAREYLPAEDFSQIAESALDQAQEDRLDGIPILLSGILPEPMALLDEITQMGGLIVADDLACCGRRLYPEGRSQEPFLRMSEDLLGSAPSWSWGSPIQDRIEHLKALVQDSGARGVVFYNIKFCEPECFDLPNLRQMLNTIAIPSTVVEVDINDPLSNQVLTRIEAFLEMIA
jgi:benzoyl-CoA reductase/2-hydroxyglutaryl-CoA dehydratase subunit BcrC/BadD/HgdB